MRTLRGDFERHMNECGRSVGLRDKEGFYIADQVEQRWQSYQAATERAAKLAEDACDASPIYRDEYDICNELAAAIRSGGEAGS